MLNKLQFKMVSVTWLCIAIIDSTVKSFRTGLHSNAEDIMAPSWYLVFLDQCLPSCGVRNWSGEVEGPSAIVLAATVKLYEVNGASAATVTLVMVVLMTLAWPVLSTNVTLYCCIIPFCNVEGRGSHDKWIDLEFRALAWKFAGDPDGAEENL